jgi:hypothetical protein
MASQQAVRTAPGTYPAPPPVLKKQRARAFDYTKWRVNLARPEDFASYLAGYPDTKGLQLYIYRVLPKIDTGLIGIKEHAIYKTFEVAEMTTEFVGRRFGRGKYKFTLNDQLRDKGEREVSSVSFILDDPYPDPVYDVRTLCLGHGENIDEVNRLIERGVLVRDASGVPRLRTDRDGPINKSESPAAASNPVGNDLINQIVLQALKATQTNPQQQFEQILATAKLLQPGQAPQLSVDEIVEKVVARLGGVMKGGGRSEDMFQTWERMEAFLEKARGPVAAAANIAAGAGQAGPVSEWAELLKSATAFLPELIHGLEFFQTQRAAYAAANNGGAAVPPVPVRRAPGVSQTAASAGAPENYQPTAKDQEMVKGISEVADICLQKMNEGMDGYHVAAYVCEWIDHGKDTFRFLAAKGTDGVMGLLTMTPQAAHLLSNPEQRAKIESFLDEFFSYDPDVLPDDSPAESAADKTS